MVTQKWWISLSVLKHDSLKQSILHVMLTISCAATSHGIQPLSETSGRKWVHCTPGSFYKLWTELLNNEDPHCN